MRTATAAAAAADPERPKGRQRRTRRLRGAIVDRAQPSTRCGVDLRGALGERLAQVLFE